MLYALMKPLLFSLPPEIAHHVSLSGLQIASKLHLSALFLAKSVQTPTTVMGLTFPNQVGLGAGLDKNGEYIAGLANLGFGFIEVGTITPRPQAGNPSPRLFRLPQAQALINRMGFNNHGVDVLINNVKKTTFDGILGINIGKNFDTPLENAHQDYLICLEKVYPYADYITVNLSSPNTKGLRELQHGQALEQLLNVLKNRQQQLADEHGKYVPLVIKIAPDLSGDEIQSIGQSLLKYKIDGVIATNTTNDHREVSDLPDGQQQGGLSGAPLFTQSTAVLTTLTKTLQGQIPIIGVGGISQASHAKAKLTAGASLVQVYTGLIYQGPALIQQLTRELAHV